MSGRLERQGWRWLGSVTIGLTFAIVSSLVSHSVLGQSSKQALTLRADVQQANALTGVVTARGNVQLLYPARQIRATAAQAQYFSRERRIVLSGNVYVTQEGNSLRAESVTYLIDEERFVALPNNSGQVESTIMIRDNLRSNQSSQN